MRKFRDSFNLKLRFSRLRKESLHLRAYSGKRYVSNQNESSQIGFTVFLAHADNSGQPVYWLSKKSKQVKRSVPGSEVMLLANAFGYGVFNES